MVCVLLPSQGSAVRAPMCSVGKLPTTWLSTVVPTWSRASLRLFEEMRVLFFCEASGMDAAPGGVSRAHEMERKLRSQKELLSNLCTFNAFKPGCFCLISLLPEQPALRGAKAGAGLVCTSSWQCPVKGRWRSFVSCAPSTASSVWSVS